MVTKDSDEHGFTHDYTNTGRAHEEGNFPISSKDINGSKAALRVFTVMRC